MPHFFKICHGVMIPIHKNIYNRDAPSFSQEAEVDILPIASGLGKNYSHISECLAVLPRPVFYHFMS